MNEFSSPDSGWVDGNNINSQIDESVPVTVNIDDDEPENLREDTETDELIRTAKNPMWSFAFYQEYFNVDTTTVLKRIKGSIIPLPSANFSQHYIQGKPDMYGPFWICATLVVLIGICGNLSTLLNNFSSPDYVYRPQFELLPAAAAVIYCYVFVVPLVIKLTFWWRSKKINIELSHIICIYGYSLFVYIPCTALFAVPYPWFNWTIVAVSAILSGAVIILSFRHALRFESRKMSSLLMAIFFILHVATMVMLRLYFFSPIKDLRQSKINNVNTENAVLLSVNPH